MDYISLLKNSKWAKIEQNNIKINFYFVVEVISIYFKYNTTWV